LLLISPPNAPCPSLTAHSQPRSCDLHFAYFYPFCLFLPIWLLTCAFASRSHSHTCHSLCHLGLACNAGHASTQLFCIHHLDSRPDLCCWLCSRPASHYLEPSRGGHLAASYRHCQLHRYLSADPLHDGPPQNSRPKCASHQEDQPAGPSEYCRDVHTLLLAAETVPACLAC